MTAGLSASWEPDLFGRLGKTRDAATLDAEGRQALLQSTRLLVQSAFVEPGNDDRHRTAWPARSHSPHTPSSTEPRSPH